MRNYKIKQKQNPGTRLPYQFREHHDHHSWQTWLLCTEISISIQRPCFTIPMSTYVFHSSTFRLI